MRVSMSFELHSKQSSTIRRSLAIGENYTIESKDPLMCVYFVEPGNIRLCVYVDGELFQTATNFTDVAGIDFGMHKGKLIITALSATKFWMVAVVFPYECKSHRFISSFPDFNILFSKDSSNADTKITSSQSVCIWPAQPYDHTLKITTDTEKDFDRLILYGSPGAITEISGNREIDIFSKTGDEYLFWQSDSTGISNSFRIKTSIMEEPYGPLFQIMIHGTGTNDVILLITHKEGLEPPDDNSKVDDINYLKVVLPYIITLTIVLIITAIIFGSYALFLYYHLNKHATEQKHEDNYDKKEYLNAHEECFPLPFTGEGL